jgi:hypothetical protein
MPADPAVEDPIERRREVTRWFKPVWYGEAREAGHTRWVPVHPDDLEWARREGADKTPDEVGYVDDEGRVNLTEAPRPDNWIETVMQLHDAGLSKARIADNVRVVMAAPIDREQRWSRFVDLCQEQLHTTTDAG